MKLLVDLHNQTYSVYRQGILASEHTSEHNLSYAGKCLLVLCTFQARGVGPNALNSQTSKIQRRLWQQFRNPILDCSISLAE